MEDKKTLWGGRFESNTSSVLQSLNSSIEVDKAMWAEDILGSIMYSKAIMKAGLLTEHEQQAIEEGLNKIHDEWSSGNFLIHTSDEDIHTANERRLKELVGPIGGSLHTGRSRNDQVAVDTRMWLKNHLRSLSIHLMDVIKVLIKRAEENTKILLPGYTHLQRGQAIRLSHWLMSHAWQLFNDLQKLRFVYWSTDTCPLGSGALAGNPFSIDRRELAQNLDFSNVSQNSLLAVADRDFVAEYLFWCSLTSCHLSGLAEDLILYSSAEFGFITLADSFTTGSSLMPQKKNPDSLELIRGKAGRMIGNVTAFLAVLKGLPSTYNKDFQEDKELLFHSARTMESVLQVAAGTLDTLKVNEEACSKGLTEDMLATDLAYFLVRKGMPFREAHEKSGEVVKKSERLKCSLSKVPLEVMQELCPLFTSEVLDVFNFERSVEQYSAEGGTSSSSVARQISNLKQNLEKFNVKTI